MLPDPLGGASIGDLYAGVPAVVESPSATMVMTAATMLIIGKMNPWAVHHPLTHHPLPT